MAISLVGNIGGGAINGGNGSSSLPAGTAQNDVCFVVIGGVSYTIATAGYTQIATVTSGTHVVRVYRKIQGATPDTTFAFTGSGNTADAVSYIGYVLRGVNTTTPEDATPTTASGNSTNPDCPSITTVTDNAWVLAMASNQANDASITGPTGYSNFQQVSYNDTNASSTGAATLLKTTAGAENPPSFTGWNTGTWGAITVAVRPSDVSFSVTGVNGTGQVGTVSTTISVAPTITGVSATGQVGTVYAGQFVTVILTGVYGTGQTGTVTTTTGTGIVVSTTGNSAQGRVGTVTVTTGTGVTVALTGVYGQTLLGTATFQQNTFANPVGVYGTGQVGHVDAFVAVSVIGVQATGYVGKIAVWIAIDDRQTNNWQLVNTFQI